MEINTILTNQPQPKNWIGLLDHILENVVLSRHVQLKLDMNACDSWGEHVTKVEQ